MALTQITFDFDDEGKKPDEKILSVKKRKPIIAEPPLQIEKLKRGRKELKNIHLNADLIDIPEDKDLFTKSYYTIGNVAKMFKVTGSLLRFWENEFDVLQPKKNGKGNRLFRPEDIKNLKVIYHLLREKKYTIEGAKEYFKQNKKVEENYELVFSLKKIKTFLLEIKAEL